MTSANPVEGERGALVEVARRAAGSLAQSVADKPDETPIETNVVTLRNLADLLHQLVTEVQRCAGSDCFGRSHDGIKTWVTRDWAEAQISRSERYEEALRKIVTAAAGGDGALAMLVDWHGVSTEMSGFASAALSDP